MKFTIKDRITTAEPNAVLSYALDYRAEFEVDEEWTDKVITARFVHSNGEYIDVVLDNFGCNIPLFPKGVLWVGAYTDSFTSTAVPVPIGVTIKDLGEHEAIPPTADVYQQIIALIEAGRLKGDKGDPGEDYIITESDYQAIADRVPQPDLTDYVKNTDYATSERGGVVMLSKNSYATDISNGYLVARDRTYQAYQNASNLMLIGKGTLENVLAERLKEPQFELIEEIVSDGSTIISRSAEPNGTPYKFKKLTILLQIATSSSFVGTYISRGTTFDWSRILCQIVSNNSGSYNRIEIDTNYGLLTCKSFYRYGLSDNDSLTAVACNPNKTTNYNNGYIDSFNFRSAIPSGSTIKIYGIRA